MEKAFIVFIFSWFIVSCVSFNRSQYNGDITKINEKNYEIFNASYENSPFEKIIGKDFREKLSAWEKACLKDYLKHKSDLYLPNCDKDKLPKLKIDKQNNKYYLVVSYDSNDGEKIEYKIKGNFSNGFFKLDNYEFESRGIPYIFGGKTTRQSRVGLDANGNLIIEKAWDSSGAALLIFWAGNSGSYGLKFRRVNKN